MTENKKCENCGTLNEEDSEFCGNCGNPLNFEKLITPEHNMTNRDFCPFCGQKISMNTEKCEYCGKWVDSSKKDSHNVIIFLGYVFSLLFAIIGLIIAIYLLSRDSSRNKKHGTVILVITLVNMILGAIMGYMGLIF